MRAINHIVGSLSRPGSDTPGLDGLWDLELGTLGLDLETWNLRKLEVRIVTSKISVQAVIANPVTLEPSVR